MNFPTETSPREFPVGQEGGAAGGEFEAAAALDRYQDMRWCVHCGGPARFVPCFDVDGGRVGVCWGCDKEVFVPFTRMNSEAA